MKLKFLILSALFAALTAVGALYPKIPIPGTTLIITLQTLFVFMAGLLLEPKYALFSQLIYTAIGLIGLPVFSTGGGIGYIFEPSFGFIIGFCACAVVVSAVVRKNVVRYNSEKNKRLQFIVKAIAGMLLSIFVLYLFGISYMYIIYNFRLNETKTVYSLIFGTTWIFMLVDLVKFSFVLPLCMAILRRLPKTA
jgi:biotin transport system substrate-specific component